MCRPFALGAVFLAVTGAEALYADMGHFGRKPIQMAWLGLVLPALALNYLGQGALLLAHPEKLENPFYLLYPEWALLPMVVLATMATIIASQAVITGAFSMTQQAIQLGLLPRFEIRRTSETEKGQIYMPRINWLLLVAVVLFLVVIFKSSSALAAAYGIAVTGTMVVDGHAGLLRPVDDAGAGRRRVRPGDRAVPRRRVRLPAANLLKVHEGGWMPLARRRRAAGRHDHLAHGNAHPGREGAQGGGAACRFRRPCSRGARPQRVAGHGRLPDRQSRATCPAALLHNLKHNKVLHEQNVILNVAPRTRPGSRTEPGVGRAPVRQLLAGDAALRLHGDAERAKGPAGLPQAGLEVRRDADLVLPLAPVAQARGASGMPLWQDKLFIGSPAAPATRASTSASRRTGQLRSAHRYGLTSPS